MPARPRQAPRHPVAPPSYDCCNWAREQSLDVADCKGKPTPPTPPLSSRTRSRPLRAACACRQLASTLQNRLHPLKKPVSTCPASARRRRAYIGLVRAAKSYLLRNYLLSQLE